MSDDRWRDTYDAWKLAPPHDEPGYARAEAEAEAFDEEQDFYSMCDPVIRSLDDIEEEEYEGYLDAKYWGKP